MNNLSNRPSYSIDVTRDNLISVQRDQYRYGPSSELARRRFERGMDDLHAIERALAERPTRSFSIRLRMGARMIALGIRLAGLPRVAAQQSTQPTAS